jgi:hypothetical protein
MTTVARHSSTQHLAAIALGLSLFSMSDAVMAQSTIRQPGAHPQYQAELEPHLLWGPYDPPDAPTGEGLGIGLRATIPVMQNGFVPTINNSIGVSFGVDWLHYWGNDHALGACSRWELGPGGTNICTEVGGEIGGPSNYLLFPLAMQWNFWLVEKFSAFGEPGLTFYWEKGRYQSNSDFGVTPLLQVGGRWHFMPRSTLTLRIGYPNISLGVSVLL